MSYVTRPFTGKSKIIESGKIGKVATVSQTEHIGYYHFAHSYVRELAAREDSAPMILAKACHDLDIIQWLVGEKCEAISSFGNLFYFKETPRGAPNIAINAMFPSL